MHILYIHQYFVPPDGVGASRSYEMARRLVDAGHEVTMVTSSAKFPLRYGFSRLINDLQLDGIHLKVVRAPYSNTYSYTQRLLSFMQFVVKSTIAICFVRKYDIVFATSTPLTIALPAMIARLRRQCPLVFEVRDLWPKLPIAVGVLRNPVIIWAARLLEKSVYLSSARVIALSAGMKDGIVRAGCPADKVAVVPNACDISRFRVPPKAGVEFLNQYHHLREGPIVTYAGTLGPFNGVEYLVDVAEVMLRIQPGIPTMRIDSTP